MLFICEPCIVVPVGLWQFLLLKPETFCLCCFCFAGLTVSVPGMEKALHQYTLEPSDKPFDMKTVPLATAPIFEQKAGNTRASFKWAVGKAISIQAAIMILDVCKLAAVLVGSGQEQRCPSWMLYRSQCHWLCSSKPLWSSQVKEDRTSSKGMQVGKNVIIRSANLVIREEFVHHQDLLVHRWLEKKYNPEALSHFTGFLPWSCTTSDFAEL